MLRRHVLQCRAGEDGSILAVGNRGESWSPRAVELVADDIENGSCEYVVPSIHGDYPIAVTRRGTVIELVCAIGPLHELPGC